MIALKFILKITFVQEETLQIIQKVLACIVKAIN